MKAQTEKTQETKAAKTEKKNPCEGCTLKSKCLNGWIRWNGSEYPCSDRYPNG